MTALPSRRTLTAAAVAVAVPAALLISAGPASATDWNGRSPIGTSCANDAQTVHSAALTNNGQSIGATIQLRYSPSCRTAWARIIGGTVASPGDNAGGAAAIHRSDGERYLCNVTSGNDCVTAMVNDAGYTSYAHGTEDTGFAIYDGTTLSY